MGKKDKRYRATSETVGGERRYKRTFINGASSDRQPVYTGKMGSSMIIFTLKAITKYHTNNMDCCRIPEHFVTSYGAIYQNEKLQFVDSDSRGSSSF